MNYVGDYTAGDTVMIYFNTFDSNDPSASVTMTNFVNTDVHIHKNDSLTQRNNAAGITVDVDVDAIAGCHLIKIDTADNTVGDFFVAGADYGVRIEGVTVDGATLNPFVGHFSLENRHVAGSMVKTTIATLAGQTSFTLTAGSADNDAYNGCTAVITDIASAVQKAVGRISDYTGATKTVTLAADPGVFTMAASDRIHIFATSALANVSSIAGTAQTANDNGADINDILTDTGTTLDGAISTIDGNVDSILTDTGTTLQGELDAIQAAVITNAAGADIAADIIAVKAETASILTDTGTTLDGKIDTIDTNVDAVLVDTGTTLQGELDAIQAAVITNAAGADIAADIIAVKAETASILTDTGTTLDGAISTIDGNVDSILTDTGTTLQGELDAIQAAVITNAAGADIAADIIAVKAETASILTDTGTTLDGKIDTIDTNVDAVLVDTGTTLDGKIDTIDTNVDSILSDTGTDGVLLATDSVDADALKADAVDEILDEVIEGTTTMRHALKIMLSALACKSAGGGTATITFRDVADGKDRITATVDANGNRTAITLDGA